MRSVSDSTGESRRDLLDQPRILVGVVEGEERPVARALGVGAGKPRLRGGNGAPCHISLAAMPRRIRSSWAALMSETISTPTAEPGATAVIPLPNVTEHPDPGGVNWTMRTSFVGATSSSSRQPKRWYHTRSRGAKRLDVGIGDTFVLEAAQGDVGRIHKSSRHLSAAGRHQCGA